MAPVASLRRWPRHMGNSPRPRSLGKLAYGSNEKAGAARVQQQSPQPIERQPANLAALTHQLQEMAAKANGSPT